MTRFAADHPQRTAALVLVNTTTRYVAADDYPIGVRDRHCQHPAGCDVPAEACQIDHIVEYVDGGPTTLDNGRALCRTHNRQRPGRRRAPPDPAA